MDSHPNTASAVLAAHSPVAPDEAAAAAYEQTAERLEASATQAERRAKLHSLAGRSDEEVADRASAQRSRRAAEGARNNAARLRALHADGQPDSRPSLTPRETEVLQLASHGLSSAEIGEQLTVSRTTIKTHFEHIYAKLASSDRAAAVATALRFGLID